MAKDFYKYSTPYNYSKAYNQVMRLSQGHLSVYENYHKQWLGNRVQSRRLNENQLEELRSLSRRAELQKLIQGEIKKEEGANAVTPKNNEEENRKNILKKWNTCVQAISIGARSGYAYGHLYFQDRNSTDTVQQQVHGIRAAETMVSVGLSLVPVFGPALASTWSFATQIFSRHISNSIQRRGDAKRIMYNFANYDLGKYGTYAYDNTSQEWVSEDANKVQSRILGQKKSV